MSIFHSSNLNMDNKHNMHEDEYKDNDMQENKDKDMQENKDNDMQENEVKDKDNDMQENEDKDMHENEDKDNDMHENDDDMQENGCNNMHKDNEDSSCEITMEIESIEINGNYYYAPDFEIISYDEKHEKCTECAFCKRSLYEYSYNIITDNKSLLNDNKVIIGKCGHMFHKDCMDSWIKCGNTICPIDKVTWEEHRIADYYTSLPVVNKIKKNNNYRFYNVNKYSL
jgi:hypothetical protein